MDAPSPLIQAGGKLPVQFAWDSTTLQNFIACPRRYEYANREGWTTRSAKIELEFGILYHKAHEWFALARLREPSHDAAIRAVLRSLIAAMRATPPSFAGVPDPETGELRFIKTERTPFSLLRAFVNHADRFEHDPMQTLILSDGRPAVEMSFRVELEADATPSQPFILSGHLDRVAEMNGQRYFLDHKTTKNQLGSHYFDQYNLDIQMDNYYFGSQIILAEPMAGGLIDATQLAVGFTRNERGIIHRTPEEVNEGIETNIFYMKLAREYALAGSFPMNKKSCFLCQFKSVCGRPPSVRSALLRSEFVQVKPWNPLEPR